QLTAAPTSHRSHVESDKHISMRQPMSQYINRHASPPVSFAFALLFATNMSAQSKSGVAAEVVAVYPRSEALYLDLHQHPELSFHEVETAAKLANELRQLGYEVTTGVGRTGIVGVMKNGAGPTVMLRPELDALLTRFPPPDFAIAVHDDARLPAGIVGYHAGPILTNADALNIKIFGRGGHGARPEATVDPIVIAARTVLALQTIVSRETSPF